jgi:hypothetical protein
MMINQKENEVSNVRGVKALCAGVDAISRRMDAFEESKAKSCCNK